MIVTFTVTVDVDYENIIGHKEQIAMILEDVGTVKFIDVEGKDGRDKVDKTCNGNI